MAMLRPSDEVSTARVDSGEAEETTLLSEGLVKKKEMRGRGRVGVISRG